MLDKTSKIFLDWLNTCDNKAFHYTEEFEYPPEIGDSNDFFALVRFLEESGYVDIIRSNKSGISVGVQLSHKGRHWREFRRQERLKYLKDNWIDFFAFFASAIALAVSIFSRT